jgi:hypothetical protein
MGWSWKSNSSTMMVTMAKAQSASLCLTAYNSATRTRTPTRCQSVNCATRRAAAGHAGKPTLQAAEWAHVSKPVCSKHWDCKPLSACISTLQCQPACKGVTRLAGRWESAPPGNPKKTGLQGKAWRHSGQVCSAYLGSMSPRSECWIQHLARKHPAGCVSYHTNNHPPRTGAALQHLLAPRTCCQVRRQRVDAEMWANIKRNASCCAGPKAEGCRFVTQQRTVFGWCTSSSCVSTATTTHGAKQQHLYTYRNTLSGALVCWFGFSRNKAQPELSPQVYEQTTIAGVRFKGFPRGWWCRETPFWVGLLLATHSQQQQCCCKLQVARQQQL